MLRIARTAQVSANESLPPGERIQVLVNSSDGLGHSYGAHLDVLVSRAAYEEVFDRRMQYLLWLASYMVSSIVFTGQGKVGSENGAPRARFQISQRADFFECLVGPQTTYHRPIVNSRDEALVGPWSWSAGGASPLERLLARMHVIFYDATLAYASSLLKIGVLQIVLAMIEAEWEPATGLILEAPLEALGAWSRDPDLREKARVLTGGKLTAVELQLAFHEQAERFVASGACGAAVPEAREILRLWRDTLEMLERRDFASLASRVDWALKLAIVRGAMDAHPRLDWDSPEVKLLDHLYASLEPEEGLFWTYDREDLLERVVSEAEIRRFTREPPDTTRAYTRAMLLRRAGADAVNEVDWDSVDLRVPDGRGRETRRRIRLWNPLGFTRSATESLLQEAASLEEIVEALEENPMG
jgi:proteasome accessory factor A